MPVHPSWFSLASTATLLVLGLIFVPVSAQPPQQLAAVAEKPPVGEGPEVLARGPVHEAFAASVEQPSAGEVIPKVPPAPIEELPPDQKPGGDNVQWMPGYWQWDNERTDFIWVSGFWRAPPPGRAWVPGSWHPTQGGSQWVHGFWQAAAIEAAGARPVQHELEYLPQPPVPIEAGPVVPAPTAASVYVPGSWVWRGHYVWRPGFWVAHRPGWIWIPAHYRWTPVGHIFVDGYWDYPLATRGVLFTPVYFPPGMVVQAGYVYTPTYVVAEPVLVGALFARNGYGAYYFGDYYDTRYVGFGYRPWCAPALRGSIYVGPYRGWSYDPMWSYYSVTYRDNPRWNSSVAELYVGRYQGTVARPPQTLVQQNAVIQQITNTTNVRNVTNNITVVNNNISVNNTNVSNHIMIAPLTAAAKLQPDAHLQPIAAQARQVEAQHAVAIRQVAVARQQSESLALRSRPIVQPGAIPQAPQPVKMRLDLPQAAVARAQIQDEKRLAPPPLHAKIDRPGIATNEPNMPPRFDAKQPGPPSAIHPNGSPVGEPPNPSGAVAPGTGPRPTLPLPPGHPPGGPKPMPKGKKDEPPHPVRP